MNRVRLQAQIVLPLLSILCLASSHHPLRANGAPELLISDNWIIFEPTDLGARRDSDVVAVVCNAGSDRVTVTSATLTNGDVGDFIILRGGGGGVLEPGDCLDLRIRYQPVDAGRRRATMSIEVEGGVVLADVIALEGQCDAISSPELLDFGDVLQGRTKQMSVSALLVNRWTRVISIESIELINAPNSQQFAYVAGPNAGFTLAPGDSTWLQIDFAPDRLSNSEAIIRVLHDGPGGTNQISVRGRGVGAIPRVAMTSFLFWIHVCDSAREERTFVSNTGNIPLVIHQMRWASGGYDFDAFFTSGGGATAVVQPGDSVQLVVRFTPRAAGQFVFDTLSIDCDSMALKPLPPVELLGRSELARVSLTPSFIDFLDAYPLTTHDTTVTVANAGTVPISWSTPFGAGSFTVLSVTPNVTQAGTSSTALVRFSGEGSAGVYSSDIPFETGYCGIKEWLRLSVRVRDPDTVVIHDTLRCSVIAGNVLGVAGTIVSIPILFKTDSIPESVTSIAVSGLLRFNRTLLLPAAATPPGFVEGDDRVIPFNLPVSDRRGDTLATLTMLALVGDHVSTPLTLDSLDVTGVSASITAADGLFTLDGFCRTGSPRLVKGANDVSLRAIRTPSGLRVVFLPNQDGLCRVAVFDLLGRNVTERLLVTTAGKEAVLDLVDPGLSRLPVFVVVRMGDTIAVTR